MALPLGLRSALAKLACVAEDFRPARGFFVPDEVIESDEVAWHTVHVARNSPRPRVIEINARDLR